MATDIGILITSSPGICGGRPRIAGTGVSVRTIVVWYQMGMTPEEIAGEYPHLNLAQVHAALAYYHANRQQMDADMAAEEAEAQRLEREHREAREKTVTVRLYCDEDTMRHALVVVLRHRGLDVMTAFEAGMSQEADERQLAFATAEGRAIYSFNVPHFCRLHSEWLAGQRSHAGIILARQRQFSVGEQMRRLLTLAHRLSAEEMQNRLEFLGDWGE